jgi:CheY-like chemotaxis protein
MKHHVLIFAVVLALGSVTPDILACGEKYVVATRGTRFSAPPPKRTDAAILLYADPASELSRMLLKLSVAQTLQKAGYRVTEVATDPQLAAALHQQWDLAVVDFSGLRVMASQGRNIPASTVLPVSYALTGSELKDARRQYPFIIKAPTRATMVLDAVDAALQAQRKRGAPANP